MYAQPAWAKVGPLLDSLGTYPPQNRAAVRRDTEQLLQNAASLDVAVADLVRNDGRTSKLLQLAGTVPIFFKRARYNIPVHIWIEENYPYQAPTCYVVPTPDMRVKQRHKHVDIHGMVYLPYLHDWKANSSTLVDLVQYMSAAFSEEPPVYRYDPSQENFFPPPAAAAPVVVPQPVRQPEPVHQAHVDERYKRKEKLAEEVTKKLRNALELFNKEAVKDIKELHAQESRLKQGQRTLTEGLAALQRDKGRLTTHLNTLNSKIEVVEQWLALNEHKNKVDIDAVVFPSDVWSKQILDAVATDHAIDDTLDALDELLGAGKVDVKTYLRLTRQLAREQFNVRALSIKVADLLLQAPPRH